MIPVTKSFFPPLEEYNFQLERIWESQWLTNRGALVLELEEKVKKYLNSTNILITNNGTVPLQIALKVLGEKKEIITTAFSYVATTASIVWENCKPVFVDIDPEHLTIDEYKIESAITSETSAILATHVFGNPCNIEAIEEIAKKHNLKVLYDAAHCFGVKYKNKSIFNYGDVSTCSFHATKLFHSVEGGATICHNPETLNKLNLLRSFGHLADDYFCIGINAKMSEFHAAMGLCVLPHIDKIIESRKVAFELYLDNLSGLPITFPIIPEGTTKYNYSYFALLFENENTRLRVSDALSNINVFTRRYF